MNQFNCKYPIFSAPMNKVSDVSLAVAVHNAGGLPSLSAFNFIIDEVFYPELLDKEIENFISSTKSNNILISFMANSIGLDSIQQLVMKHRIPYIELVEADKLDSTALKFYKDIGTKIFVKGIPNINPYIDGIVLKGPGGAGRVRKDFGSLQDMIVRTRKRYPHILIIATGGISTADQVKECLTLGADMVGIGTLFAVSEECSISRETKLKMINSTSADLKVFGKANQQGLVFSIVPNDVLNNTKSLEAGIAHPSVGIVFAGTGLDNVDSIYPVDTIMQNLVRLLR